MATRTILFRGQTRRKGERTSISGIPLPGIWVAGGVFPQNKGYDYAIIYQQNPKVENGAFLENEAPSTIWCHPRNSCLLSLRGIVGADQIVQWDTRYGEMTGKDNAIGEE